MRYSIGSVSKQFTASAILMLVEEGKLKLDDPVSQFLPQLTRAGEVTIRQLLSHTSGYQDYWPQDYVMPILLEPIDRSLFTTNANFYFSEQALKDFATGFKGLGKPLRFIQKTREERGGTTLRVFEVEFRHKRAIVLQRTLPDGKIEQYQVLASI